MSDFISLQDGIDMTSAYRGTRHSLIEDNKVTEEFLPLSETFEKEHIEGLLAQTDCVGVRIYLGEELGEVKLILVGVDSNDDDILATNSERILERGIRCPTDCPPTSALNS